MTSEIVSIKFTRAIYEDDIIETSVEVDSPSSDLSPQIVNGRLSNFTKQQIIQLEIEPYPIEVVFRGKKYKFSSFSQTGEFKLEASYPHTTRVYAEYQ